MKNKYQEFQKKVFERRIETLVNDFNYVSSVHNVARIEIEEPGITSILLIGREFIKQFEEDNDYIELFKKHKEELIVCLIKYNRNRTIKYLTYMSYEKYKDYKKMVTGTIRQGDAKRWK